MKKLLSAGLFIMGLSAPLLAYNVNWQEVPVSNVHSRGIQVIKPGTFAVFALNSSYFQQQLFALPEQVENAQWIELPTPDGSFRTFKVWQTPIMEKPLAEKYSFIKTFTAIAENNPSITATLDFTPDGFHAMILDGRNTYFIDPYSNENDGYYTVYYKKDYPKPANKYMTCGVGDEEPAATSLTNTGLPDLQYKVNGGTKKTYRLAVACTEEYAAAVGGATPTKASVLSKIVTSVNRVRGVYEKELAISFVLIANNDTLIFLPGSGDPYSNNNGSTMLGQNQTTITNRIGSANYDIGHVFSTGGGGIADLQCVCDNTQKAHGVTGSSSPVGDAFDIDYVAHEMGHQFGGSHTFNSNQGSCSGNGSGQSAYEPGSGTTIMAYAGICNNDDVQEHSDAYFHARSLDQISNFITSASHTCPVSVASGNTPPVVPTFKKTYNIPYLTPFELTAPEATDVENDPMTYCWEQWNRGTGSGGSTALTTGPIFRSFNPAISRTRVFVQTDSLLKGTTTYVGEKLPSVSRNVWFKLTVRDVHNGIGSFNFPTDTIKLIATNTSGPFEVLTPATNLTWNVGTSQTITWDVANTTATPVNCASVDIYLSADGGYTWPYILITNTPNDGSETVLIPASINSTTKARVKVKGNDNVFFNINPVVFNVYNPAGIKEISWENEVSIFPVPANLELNFSNNHKNKLNISITNALGEKTWNGKLDKQLNIHVGNWARGVYFIQMTDEVSGEKIVKPVVIQ